MPRMYKRSYRRRRKKRYRRRFKKKGLLSRIRIGRPIASKAFVRLRYATTITMDPGIGDVVTHFFSTNDLFDTDVTGSGHQPLYFDQMAADYTSYHVLSSKMTAIFSNVDAIQQTVGGIAIIPDLAAITDRDVLREMPRCNWKVMSDANSGLSQRTVTQTWSAKKYFGVKNVLDDRDIGAGVATSSGPIEQATFQVWNFGLLSGNNPASLGVSIIIDFLCCFQEPKTPPLSTI